MKRRKTHRARPQRQRQDRKSVPTKRITETNTPASYWKSLEFQRNFKIFSNNNTAASFRTLQPKTKPPNASCVICLWSSFCEDHLQWAEPHKQEKRLQPVVSIQSPIMNFSTDTISQVILPQVIRTSRLQNRPGECGLMVRQVSDGLWRKRIKFKDVLVIQMLSIGAPCGQSGIATTAESGH